MKKVILNVAAALSLMFAVSCACDCNKCNNDAEGAAVEAADSAKCVEAAKAACETVCDSAKQAAAEAQAALEATMTEAQLDSLDAVEEAAFQPVQMPSVQLKPEQQKKLKEMVDGARAKAAEIKKLPRSERRAARAALQEECVTFLNNLLDPDQLEAIKAK
ncbi:MAG: hypothetical protein MJZ27_04585 [Bacteroidales bacterium]|nr:hypothetical protein [Bacteroidales bacterium]